MKFGLHWQGNFRDRTSGNLFHVPKGTACSRDYSGSFYPAWSCPGPPCMPSYLEAKAPLRFSMGFLPPLEILPSLMQRWVPFSDIWYLSTSVALPSLTPRRDLAKYLRVWCSLHDDSDNVTAIYYLKEGVCYMWRCPQSSLRNYKIITRGFRFPCHQCLYHFTHEITH